MSRGVPASLLCFSHSIEPLEQCYGFSLSIWSFLSSSWVVCAHTHMRVVGVGWKYVRVCPGAYTCVCNLLEGRGWCWMTFLSLLCLIPWGRLSHWMGSLGGLTNELQGFVCLCPTHHWGYRCECLGSKLRSSWVHDSRFIEGAISPLPPCPLPIPPPHPAHQPHIFNFIPLRKPVFFPSTGSGSLPPSPLSTYTQLCASLSHC